MAKRPQIVIRLASVLLRPRTAFSPPARQLRQPPSVIGEDKKA